MISRLIHGLDLGHHKSGHLRGPKKFPFFSGPTSKPPTKPKPAKKVQLERTGVLWAIDQEGGLQILNGEEREATAVD